MIRETFSSVQSLSRVRLFATRSIAACQASLSITNSCPLSWWCHPTISSSVIPFSFCLESFPASGSFPINESAFHIRWPKNWSFSFSISPSNEYSGLTSLRMDWLGFFAVQGTLQESSPTPHFKSINSSALSFLYSPSLTSIHDYWKNRSLD